MSIRNIFFGAVAALIVFSSAGFTECSATKENSLADSTGRSRTDSVGWSQAHSQAHSHRNSHAHTVRNSKDHRSSVSLLVNSGLLQQSSGNQKKALSFFEKARKLDPDCWQASLGEAKSLAITGQQIECLALLQQMCEQPSTSFEGRYKLGQALLVFNKPELCVTTSSQAMQLAGSPEEQSKALQQHYLSLLRSHQESRARELQQRLFVDCKPVDEQIYIRAATVGSVLDPANCADILSHAVSNLNKSENSGTFFRLAQIFDSKARYVAYDATKYGAWLKNSEIAYRQALKLNPNPPLYRIALAANAAEQHLDGALIDELKLAHSSNPQDQLPGYLLSKLEPLQVASTSSTIAVPSSQIKLTRARLAIDGLKCACKRALIINSFKQIRGLILTTISSKFPYEATILVDESMISLNDVLSKIANKPLPEFSYRLISSIPATGATEALRLDVQGHNIVYPDFENEWPEISQVR